MSKIFNSVPGNKVKRNVFNLSHERKMSMNMGQLIPFFHQEVVPGDSFRVDSEVMMRLAPMLAPLMHRVNVYTHFFYVPNRIIWNEWEDFITGNGDPNFPMMVIDPNQNTTPVGILQQPGNLADFFGVPAMPDWFEGVLEFSSLPFRAYAEIFNEWYRDQDLIDEIQYDKSSANVTEDGKLADLLYIRNRAWEKDYFTSARPWAQKGDAVELPITGTADLVYNPSLDGTTRFTNYADGNLPSNAGVSFEGDAMFTGDMGSMGTGVNVDVTPNTTVDLSTATASTINELRRAFQLQKWLERNARSGSRYTEVLRAHFGVKSSDSRLQRPEYLGGGRQAVSISEVLQTSASQIDEPLGDMAGHGISVGKSNRFKKFFEEHGQIIGLVSVLPRTAYQQGISRFMTKKDKFDFFWPEFQHIGEQEIKEKEIFLDPSSSDNDKTFGYTPRYAEYKYQPSTVHGDFRENLSYWHMGRIFNNAPALNRNFVTADPDHRVFNVTDQNVDKLYVHVYNNVKAARPMAVYGEPGLIDH